jgi:hypothetical protein
MHGYVHAWHSRKLHQISLSNKRRQNDVFPLRMRCPVTALEKTVVVPAAKVAKVTWEEVAPPCSGLELCNACTLANSKYELVRSHYSNIIPTKEWHHSHVHRRIAHDACWCDDAGGLIHVPHKPYSFWRRVRGRRSHRRQRTCRCHAVGHHHQRVHHLIQMILILHHSLVTGRYSHSFEADVDTRCVLCSPCSVQTHAIREG